MTDGLPLRVYNIVDNCGRLETFRKKNESLRPFLAVHEYEYESPINLSS